jgi:sugar O-acyltransferase (sialic acid O-acetyltransferase NeuD family)
MEQEDMAKSLQTALLASQANLAGFVDDDERLRGSCVLGLGVFGGGFEWLREQQVSHKIKIALGIGENRVRRRILNDCLAWGCQVETVIHPTASISASAKLGQGTAVMSCAVVNPEAVVGQGVIVNSGAVVEHDVRVGDFAHVAPNASLGGAASLGSLSNLGMGAVVLPGVAIGYETLIGAGAVVIREIPDRVVAVGVPARIHRHVQQDVDIVTFMRTSLAAGNRK